MLWDETSSSDGLSNSYYFIHHPEKSNAPRIQNSPRIVNIAVS